MRLVMHIITRLILSFIGLIEQIGLNSKNNGRYFPDKQTYVSSRLSRTYS